MEVSRGELPTGTVTFLFSDIEGSTRIAGELGTAAYRELIEQHHHLMRGVFQARGGTERGTQGDGFLVVFPDAPSAVAAAVDAQRTLASASWPGGVEVWVRMGMHSGAGIPGGDDYVGLDIVRAARIADAAHGGQVLVSDSTRALAERSLPDGVTVRDVGRRSLKGLDRPERLYQLVIDDLPGDFPPPRVPDADHAHLPPRVTSFVGRHEEMEELRSLLEGNRLLTLVGPGGAGKTSLAVELARRVATDFDDGAWFVDLAPLADADLVESTMARRLGVAEQPDRPILEALSAYLATRELLLVLDNFEHLLPAAGIVATLMAAAPGLKALVTSRRVLNLYGEQEFPLPPLRLPENDSTDLERLVSSEAVTLFVERARAVKPGFSITEENAAAVRELCVRLDGLPLAIELAASRVRLLTPREILTRLEQRLPVLAATAEGRPARQQTLQAAIEWSYELLSPVEQELFTRLSVFAGGCTLEAVNAVCNPEGELGIDTLDGVASLVDQSLLAQTAAAGVSRFEMLETIREYGLQRSRESSEPHGLKGRYLRFYRDLAEAAEPHLLGPEQAEWLDRIESENANLRAALGHALAVGDIQDGLRLAAGIWRFWFQRGYLREGRSWLEELLAADPDNLSLPRAKAFSALGGLVFWLFDPDATQRAYESAMSLYRHLGDDRAAAETMYDLAFIPAMSERDEEARLRFESSLAEAKRVGSSDLVARNQIMLGITAVAAGDPHAAVPHFEEALSFFREVDDRFHLAWTIRSLGRAYVALGRLEAGREAYLEGLLIYADVRNLPGIGQGFSEIAALESSSGHHIEAMRLAGAALALRDSIGATPPLPNIQRALYIGLDDAEASAREAIGDGAVDAALAEGRHMTVDETVAYAAELLGGR